ncbi:hypothetical protein B6S44_27140 [Bosea sp. Tri-44]|uniref:DUF4268 domain-containing protein n=1 Tax=Bosea sp. Tri-44 TaxID=1972137 RepID=UPI001024B65D|nr:DUF4268 domain-containing protein [Bosea sp. Tri-44]RXT46476.1 hypothetical protein B6S44_27140 [Bosea sp. Tri-44]
MTEILLGKLEKFPLRSIWLGEATDFTPWLAENLDKLGERIGMELELESTEVTAGDFSADIVAREVSTNRKVIIENQFGQTDHRHLGQIITYAASLNAEVIVWISERSRPEHKLAIDFLNSNFKGNVIFFAVEASIVRIENSKPAFLLDVVSEPVEAPIPSGVVNETISETREKYRQYFQQLIDDLRVIHKFTNARAGQPQNWYSFSSENSKIFKYGTSFSQGGQVRVEIYIDCDDKERNEALFECLQGKGAELEASFGSPLSWEKLESRRACRIAIYRDGDIDAETELLNEIKSWSISNLIKFKTIFPNYIASCLTEISSKAPAGDGMAAE